MAGMYKQAARGVSLASTASSSTSVRSPRVPHMAEVESLRLSPSSGSGSRLAAVDEDWRPRTARGPPSTSTSSLSLGTLLQRSTTDPELHRSEGSSMHRAKTQPPPGREAPRRPEAPRPMTAREAREKRERRARLKDWLERHGYFNVNVERYRLGRISYPLHTAVKRNDAEMVRLLLRAGANPFSTNSAGLTPEALATARNWLGLKKQVLDAFADFAAGRLPLDD